MSELFGRYVATPRGIVEPDDNAKVILRRVQDMLLLGTEGMGPGRITELYVDQKDGTYWEFREFDDGQITLRRVSREYIEGNWPSVDFDHPVAVPPTGNVR